MQQLQIQHCRCIEACQLELSPNINILLGDNASGKSSFLEAISVLSRGRSFRTQHIRDVIQHNYNEMVVAGKIVSNSDQNYPIGISKTREKTKIRINHEDIQQQAELSRHLPLSVIHPDTIELITGSPAVRRALLDWITFYRDIEFQTLWKSYQRILKQRNVCLRDETQRYALSYWTEQLVQLQPKIAQLRQQALIALQQTLEQYQNLLKPLGLLEIKLSTGFPQHVDNFDTNKLLSFFKEKEKYEIKQGFTVYGVHRSDVHFYLDDLPVDKIASRGQMKLLGIVLSLAKSHSITDNDEQRGIIGIDDLASELDDNTQAVLFETLQATKQQLIITGTRLPPIDISKHNVEMFHVKHGAISTWQ